MTFRFRHRLSFTERCAWLLLALLLGFAVSGHAQVRRHARPSSAPRRATPGFADGPADGTHNHGTGAHLGVTWNAARTAARAGRLPPAFELGVFHQRALGRIGSVQGEANFYRQPTVAAAPAALGLRLPVLLVINPFDNVSFHVGPQLQWQWRGSSVAAPAPLPDGAVAPAAARLTGSMVIGGEARIRFLRLGLRYAAPLRDLYDLAAIGQRAADDWKAGQVQVYVAVLRER